MVFITPLTPLQFQKKRKAQWAIVIEMPGMKADRSRSKRGSKVGSQTWMCHQLDGCWLMSLINNLLLIEINYDS